MEIKHYSQLTGSQEKGKRKGLGNCKPRYIFADEYPHSLPTLYFSPSRPARPEGAPFAPCPCPRRIKQLYLHLASVEKARLHHSQDRQLHCALQPVGAQERLPGHLLHQVGHGLCRGEVDGKKAAGGDEERGWRGHGLFMTHALNGGHIESHNLMVTDGKGEPIQSCPLTRGPSAQPRETSCRTDLFLYSQVLGKRQPSCCPERPPPCWMGSLRPVGLCWFGRQDKA